MSTTKPAATIAAAPYNVYVRETDLDHIYDVAQQLSSAGMHIEQVAETLGVVSGSIPEDAVGRIQGLAVVDAVVPDRDVSLPE